MKIIAGIVFERIKRIHQILLDIGIFVLSWIVSYLLRFEGVPNRSYAGYVNQMLIFLPGVVFARILLFYAFSAYKIVWRYISIRDAFVLLKATAPLTLILTVLRFFAPSGLESLRVPISVIFIEFLLVLLGTGAVRAIRRVTFEDSARENYMTGRLQDKRRFS